MDFESIVASLVEKISDYRESEISEINTAHVKNWISQFDKRDQVSILYELNHIFDTYYYSRKSVKAYIKSFLLDPRISANDQKNLSESHFLCIQKYGKSQEDLLVLVKEILQEEFGISINECQHPRFYFYIDDCVFTGNRFRYDIVQWLQQNVFIPGTKLITYHLAQHAQGYNYALQYIRDAAHKSNIDCLFYYHKEINNRKQANSVPQVMWPLKLSDDDFISRYYQRVKTRCESNGWQDNCYRTHTFQQDSLFTSPQARNIVETAFLKAGSRIVFQSANPAPSVRPMGFEKLESLGFGSLFVTYRNISNNCPLALWYGNPNHLEGPLSMWYPLFLRKTQEHNWYTSLEELFA